MWRQREKELDILVRTLNKSIDLSELITLDKEHRGILCKFWRTHYPKQVSFVEWLGYMENKEVKTIKKETEMERVNRLLKEIEERYS